jgi:hypothetical protein
MKKLILAAIAALTLGANLATAAPAADRQQPQFQPGAGYTQGGQN